MNNILITGGTGLIGSKLVEELISDNNKVQFTTRSKKKGEELIKKFNVSKNLYNVLELEFNDQDNIINIVNQLNDLPDIFIHNARSIDTLSIDIQGYVSEENFAKEYYNGVIFPYLLINRLLELNSPLKDIIFISSMYGNVAPNPKLYNNFDQESPINYGITKAAQIHLTKELAVRFARKKIRTNCISYGGVEGRVSNEFKQKYNNFNPNGRMLNLNDLYPPVKYIIDNPNLNINGENLKVDGGWTIW